MMEKTERSHLLILLLVFTQITGLRSTVPEPCLLNNIPEGTIATMCKESSAVEENISGTFINDSVVLRIITQQDHCICQLTLLNQTKEETLYLRKHDGSKNAAPINNTCGLAVDIHHISIGNQTVIDPIQCTKPHSTTKITLAKNGMLQFESRQIDGNFTRGYCMEILRAHGSSIQNPTIHITCLEPDRSDETSELPTTKGGNQVPDTSNATSAPIPAQLTSTTSLVTGFEQYTENTQSQPDSKERGLTLYIAIGAGLEAVSLLIFVVTIIVLKRKKSRQVSVTCIRNAEVNTKSCQHANKTSKNELRENVLDIPADKYITTDHYNTPELENPHIPDGQYNIDADHYNTADLENRHIPDGQYNIAADHYNMADLENTYISDGQYDIVGDHYSHLHLKTQHISDKILNNDSDHYSTLDVEIQQVVDKKFSSKDGYSDIDLSKHASPLKTSRDVNKMPDPDIMPPIKSCELPDANVLNKDTFHLPVKNNTSNNLYAEVDKSHTRNEVKKDDVPKVNQTYAVVNKVARQKHDEGEVSKEENKTKLDANGTTEPDANVSTNTGSSHYENIQLPDEEVK